jgi:hypothetical protein
VSEQFRSPLCVVSYAYPRLLDVTFKQAPKARGKAAETLALPLTESVEDDGSF